MKYLYAYRNIAMPANVITVLGGYMFWTELTVSAFIYLLWYKLITSTALIAYIHFFRGSVAYFFMNLGLGRIELYGSMLSMDMGIFVICLSTLLMFS